MESRFAVSILFFLPFLAYNVKAQPPVTYDVTKFGAAPNADIGQALISAWSQACNSTAPSVVLIPQGTWPLTQVKLFGPSKAPVVLQVQGTVQAPANANQLPDKQSEWININNINNFTLTGAGGGVLDGQGLNAYKANTCPVGQYCGQNPMNLNFVGVNNSVIQDITSKDSKSFHINLISSTNVTFLRMNISAPGDSPNTDGIHMGRVFGVNINNSIIQTGDDCISIGDDSNQVYVQNVTCGPGHGISIGSLGKDATEKDVRGIFVQNCTFIGTQNGVRIKTWPSSPSTLQVSDVHYQGLIMNNVSNPIIIDQKYCPSNQCNLQKPSLIKVSNVSFDNIQGTSFTPQAVILSCSSANPCEVQLGNIALTFSGAQGPITTQCDNAKTTSVGTQSPPVCAATAPGAAPATAPGGPAPAPGVPAAAAPVAAPPA